MEETWSLVVGSWGDAFACYGNICKMLKDTGAEKTNVVYFGLNKEVLEFLKIQKGIDKVRHLVISESFNFFEYAGMAAGNFPLWMRVTGLVDQIPDLKPTHISRYYNIEHPKECHRDFECVLPPCNVDWSTVLNGEDFILFQPFSCHSCSFDKHWPHWMDALKWSLDYFREKVVLVGQLLSPSDRTFRFPWIEHPNLINLVDQTHNMTDVLHLMGMSKFVVTTSNALSMWSIISNKPAFVCANQIIKERAEYYWHWIHHRPNLVLYPVADLQDFEHEMKDWYHNDFVAWQDRMPPHQKLEPRLQSSELEPLPVS